MNGLHLTADLRGCTGDAALLHDAKRLRACCEQAVAMSGLTAVATLFHPFEPAGPGLVAGVTGVVLLAESHLAVHTWPEHGGVTLDVYVCNARRDNREAAHALMEALIGRFAPREAHRQQLLRPATGLD